MMAQMGVVLLVGVSRHDGEPGRWARAALLYHVPPSHLLRRIDAVLDLSGLQDQLAPLLKLGTVLVEVHLRSPWCQLRSHGDDEPKAYA
jgi:hypothetical protein